MYDQLEPYTRASWGQKRAHVRQVRRIEREQARGRLGRCPWCGGALVLRTARQGGVYAGRQFYGCSNYPNCRYTRDVSSGQ